MRGALEESGGPPIAGAPQQRGFGTGLLERGLAAQIGGEVALNFAATGLRCRITFEEADDDPEGWRSSSEAAGLLP
jgi:two-component sensor histidine kinase